MNFSNLLRGGSLIGGRLLTVALVKAIDAPCRVDQLLLAREKRMASRADFYVQVALLVERDLKLSPHAQVTVISLYSG